MANYFTAEQRPGDDSPWQPIETASQGYYDDAEDAADEAAYRCNRGWQWAAVERYSNGEFCGIRIRGTQN